MENFKIEPGKLYQLRNGMKYRCYAVDGGGMRPIHGAIFKDGGWFMTARRVGGLSASNDYDIISEWVDELDFDASCLPAWANKFIAMDDGGQWYGFIYIPQIDGSVWGGNEYCEIPPDFAPKNFQGNWQDSLHQIKDGKAVKVANPAKTQ